ncbi:sphingomyelin phosphodiesterase [Obba rivulosa]|uniref:Sphingomyelin phosphodiesterase n=1 Tax=Obba rivulosa TaxID=1052685 RepID=A0A8E2AMN0_9APHY|nr:sphingomyelin phosphodiesterase [Obba rivulosa]
MMRRILSFVGYCFLAGAVASQAQPGNGLGPSSFVAPGAFPTSVYKAYYNDPTATSVQPQPIVSDPVTHSVYPFDLTNPNTIPQNDSVDPHPLPPKASPSQLLSAAVTQILSISTNPVFGNDTCTRCQAALEVAKFLVMAEPEQGPPLAVQICNQFNFNPNCEGQYGILGAGSPITQAIANADVGGYDGQSFCAEWFGLCEFPPASPLNLTGWFAKPKPNPLPPPKERSGKLLKVLHLSDWHIDPRFANGAEANCTNGVCCRSNSVNMNSPEMLLVPAPRYGSFMCDSSYSLVMAALEAIPILTGTEKTGFDFMIYTGDLVSHDDDAQLSRDYVMYAETVLYGLFKRLIGNAPVYAALGNHDTYNLAQDAPHSLGGALAEQFSWNYDHVTSLWEHNGWIDETTVQSAQAHYAAYSVTRSDGLRIMTLNTDFWYGQNYFNYINLTHPDTSGMLRFLTDELQDAEDAGDRVWIMGHVVSGWDGTNPLSNPSNLFYQIVDRFSPHVIAGIFFGHDHEDQLNVYYANNATNISAETAQTVAWIGPSLTPFTNLNSGFRVYEVDSGTFDIVNSYTWFANVSAFPDLDHQLEFGPTFEFEYSARDAFGATIEGWGPDDPLNATWWHLVTEAMEADNSLVTTFRDFQGKRSLRSPACDATCLNATICYIRSGSASISRENCAPGFGSVQ